MNSAFLHTFRKIRLTIQDFIPLRELTILVADDNHFFRKTVCEFVESLGHVKIVAEAFDGDQAVELARKLHPDMILMDINMPNKTGLEASRMIKNIFPDVFIVMITLHEGSFYRQLAKDCLADEFIPKGEMKNRLTDLIIQHQLRSRYDA